MVFQEWLRAQEQLRNNVEVNPVAKKPIEKIIVDSFTLPNDIFDLVTSGDNNNLVTRNNNPVITPLLATRPAVAEGVSGFRIMNYVHYSHNINV